MDSTRVTHLSGTAIIRFLAIILAAFGWMVLSVSPLDAQQASASQLPPGPGHDLVAKNCVLCHSLDRVVSVKRTKDDWQRLVKLMWLRQAPYLDEDMPTIVDYLYTNFGRPELPPRPPSTAAALPAEYQNYDFSKPAVRGTLSGTVSADQGQVHAFSVMAHNLLYRVRYMVYTKDGRYTVPQALPGPYEIYAAEFGYSSSTVKGNLKPGETTTVDLPVTKDPAPTGVTYVDLATVYPPGAGRDEFLKNCQGCHANSPHYEKQLTPYGFRAAVDYMRWGRTSGGNMTGVGETYFANTQLSTSEMDAIGHYLGSVLDPNIKRVVRRPDYPTDENVTSKALFVEYDLPDAEVNARGGNIGFHDAFMDSKGIAWYGSGAGGGVVIGLDPKEQDPKKRMRFYGGGPDDPKFDFNGIGEDKVRHHIYFADYGHGNVGELDPVSGKIKIHTTPNSGAAHSLYGDAKGNVWYMNLYGGQIGKWDPVKERAYPYPTLSPDIGPYGATEDHAGNIWVTGIAKNLIARVDPETQTVSEFKIPTPGVGPRRIHVDSKDIVWFSEGAGQAFGRLDPKTGKFSEYKFPVPNISPYDLWLDNKNEEIVWGSDLLNDWGYSPFSYNTKTKEMHYFPAPPGTWAPQTIREANNTVWMVQRRNAQVGSSQIHFYPAGYTAEAPPEP